jgi:uncharacterized protein
MSQTIRTVGAGVLGALIVAVAALSVHAGPTTAAPTASADPASHTITVTSSGKVTILPDVARVTLGITITKQTVKAARAAAASRMNGIVSAVKGLGVADADIQTVNLSLYPHYANGSSNRIDGYSLGNQVQVTVRDLDKASDVVDAAMSKGATQVNGISFDVADPAKALDNARAAAIAAAQVSAQAMAAAGHISLGAVVSITDSSPASPVYSGGMRLGALDAATPIKPGSEDLSATVTVVFAIG